MTPLEKDIERGLVKQVKALGGLCLKWVCPGWAGVPDRIILLPGGSIWFVELKRPKDGRLSERQVWWRDKLHGLGFPWASVWSHEEAKNLAEALRSYNNLLKDLLEFRKIEGGHK